MIAASLVGGLEPMKSLLEEITLEDLIACTKEGYLLVAESAVDGDLVHINDTVSGKDCNCVCPGCGRAMVARKGEINTHTFAHLGTSDGFNCTSAGETALHKFAKQVLSEEMRLYLPPIEVSDKSGPLIVSKAQTLEFELVELEKRDGQVVPDVTCQFRGHRLHVEFCVTHPVDEAKLAKLVSMGVGVIEIDLAPYRHMPLHFVKDAIVSKADRRWLHSRKFIEGEALLRARAQEMEREADERAGKLAATYRRMDPQTYDVGIWEGKAVAYGLEDALIPIGNARSCFKVRDQEWKAYLLLHQAVGWGNPVPAHRIFRKLKDIGWVHKSFGFLDEAMVDRIREHEPEFVSPYEACLAFLDRMVVKAYLIQRGVGYVKGGALEQIVEIADAGDTLSLIRDIQLRALVSSILGHLPAEEQSAFDYRLWLAHASSHRGLTPDLFLVVADEMWNEYCAQLEGIRAGLDGKRIIEPDANLHGLPVQKQLESMRLAKIQEAARRRLVKEADDKREADLRVASITEYVNFEFGEAGLTWAKEPKAWLDGLSPIEAVQQSAALEAEVRWVIRKNVARRDEKRRQDEEREASVQKLRQKAVKSFPTEVHADLWLRQSLKDLGGKKPIEYVIDDKTLDECIQLLPEARR